MPRGSLLAFCSYSPCLILPTTSLLLKVQRVNQGLELFQFIQHSFYGRPAVGRPGARNMVPHVQLLLLAQEELGWAGRTGVTPCCWAARSSTNAARFRKDQAVRAPACSTLEGPDPASPRKLGFDKSWPLLAIARSEPSI